MRELIAPFEMVYRNKLDYDVWAKYVSLKEGDSEDDWELVPESAVEKKAEPYEN